jgi:hypothetical protein
VESGRKLKMKLEELSPEVFLWELYNPNGLHELSAALCIKESSFGWCDASRLFVRPKSGLIALMIEWYDGTKFWCHANEHILDSIRFRIKRQEESEVK